MALRTETSLDELLAEPMVKLLMRKDGVSIGDARALYDRVRPRLEDVQQRIGGGCSAVWRLVGMSPGSNLILHLNSSWRPRISAVRA